MLDTTDVTIVVAHAGGSAHAPANTIGAYHRAHSTWASTADVQLWMEFDAQFSADDQLMAIHDETLDRTTDATGFVSDRTAAELRECNAAAGWEGWDHEPVVQVRDILEEGRHEDWRLIAEIKNIPGQRGFDQTGERYAEAFCALVEETGFPLDRLVVICFWAPTLDAIRERRTDIALGYLSVPELPGGAAGMSAADNLAHCRRQGYDVSAPRHTTPDLDADHVAAAHEHGIQAHAWTMNEPHEIARAVEIGLDGITSDHPDRVFEALRT